MEEIYKKGTILLRKPLIDEQSEKLVATEEVKDEINGQSKTEKQHTQIHQTKVSYEVVEVYENLIDCDAFYTKYSLID